METDVHRALENRIARAESVEEWLVLEQEIREGVASGDPDAAGLMADLELRSAALVWLATSMVVRDHPDSIRVKLWGLEDRSGRSLDALSDLMAHPPFAEAVRRIQEARARRTEYQGSDEYQGLRIAIEAAADITELAAMEDAIEGESPSVDVLERALLLESFEERVAEFQAERMAEVVERMRQG